MLHQRLRRAAALGLGVGVLVAVTACSSSAPAQLTPTGHAAARTADPDPSESLLGPSDADTHSAVGRVVDGFPVDLVPVPAGATVLMSSAAPVPGGDLVDISLNVRSPQDAAGLLAAVSGPLVAAGFTSVAPQAEPGLAAQGAYTRGNGELVTAGVLDRDGVRTLTVGGTVRATK